MRYRSNLLFVVLDQFRADLLHGALAAHVDLPHLRALMAEGVSFARHYAVTAPCGPARASLLTGQYAMTHRSVRNGTPLPHDTPNLAQELRKLGYLPRLFGYCDVAADPRAYAAGDPALTTYEQVLPGFHEALEMRMEESWAWRSDLLAKGYDVPPYPEIYRPRGPRIDDPALYAAKDSDTAFLADRTIAGLRGLPPGWCAHVTFLRPHPPFVAPAPYNRMYDPAALPPPAGAPGAHPFDAISRRASWAGALTVGVDRPATPQTVQTLRALYLGLATEVDHHLGRILRFLKETGVYEDTLIVVTADHGEMLGDHGVWGKTTYRDAAFHVPLIVRDPEARDTAGQVVWDLTDSIDVAPTLLSRLGHPVPETMAGRALGPYLRGTAPERPRRYGMSELDFGNPLSPTPWQAALSLPAARANLAVLRSADHTLVHFNGDLPPLLFETGRTEDLAADPSAAPLLLQMTRALLDLRMTAAGGRFARTMITAEGPQQAARGGP